MTPTVGVMLQPDAATLDELMPAIEIAGHLALTPETTWHEDEDGRLLINSYHARFASLVRRRGVPAVAHAVGFDLGGLAPRSDERRRRRLQRLREDHATFEFAWLTDHLGTTCPAGQELALPLPVPMTDLMARVVRSRLVELQSVVPVVGVEYSAACHLLGSPLDEPEFLSGCTESPGLHVLLDLENLLVMSHNLAFPPDEWLRRADLTRVVEIHLASGGTSDPAWLPGREVLRLDEHDRAVSEECWELLELVLPRCPALRGVTVERMEGTLSPGQGADVAAELARARRLVELAA